MQGLEQKRSCRSKLHMSLVMCSIKYLKNLPLAKSRFEICNYKVVSTYDYDITKITTKYKTPKML